MVDEKDTTEHSVADGPEVENVKLREEKKNFSILMNRIGFALGLCEANHDRLVEEVERMKASNDGMANEIVEIKNRLANNTANESAVSKTFAYNIQAKDAFEAIQLICERQIPHRGRGVDEENKP
jgi:hypothetical protein